MSEYFGYIHVRYVLDNFSFKLRGGSRMIPEGVRLDQITVLYVFGQTSLGKQCRPRSDVAERGV